MTKGAKRRKRRTILYCTFLVILAAGMFVLIFMGLGILGRFADDYEAAVPDYAVDEYMDSLNANGWNDTMNQAASAMANDFQTADDCVQTVKGTLEPEFTKIKAPSTDENVTNYSVINGKRTIGSFSIIRDTSATTEFDIVENYGMDLHPWKFNTDSYNFDYLYKSVEETVPSTYTVKINDIPLDEKYITESGIHYDVLDAYYEDYQGLPTKVTYKVDNLVGDVDVAVYDSDGNPYTIDWTQDDSQYIKPCSQEELAQFQEFADQFVEAYEYFFGTKNLDNNLPWLSQYVKPGSALADLMQAQVESGTGYIHYDYIIFNSKVFNGAYALGGNFYVIDETVESTTTGATTYKTVHETTEIKIIVVKEGDQILAVDVA